MTRLKEPTPPTLADVGEAKEATRELRAAFPDLGALGLKHPSLQLVADDGEVSIRLPAAIVGLLAEILRQMAEGKAVALMPYHMELTTQEAADLLNVSRPFFVRLCESGEIPFTRLRRHRRIKLPDLLAYRSKQEEKRQEALTDLIADAQDLGLGY